MIPLLVVLALMEPFCWARHFWGNIFVRRVRWVWGIFWHTFSCFMVIYASLLWKHLTKSCLSCLGFQFNPVYVGVSGSLDFFPKEKNLEFLDEIVVIDPNCETNNVTKACQKWQAISQSFRYAWFCLSTRFWFNFSTKTHLFFL